MNSRLARSPKCYVSGHPSFSKRLGLPNSAISTLRWFGNRNMGYRPLLVIEAPPEIWIQVTESIRQSAETLREVREFILDAPAPTLIFGGVTAGSAERSIDAPPQFLFSLDGKEFRDFKTVDLRGYFGSINPDFVQNLGTTKDINTTQNDSFQVWTRRNLSRYIVASDVDAMDTDAKILFELKRGKGKSSDWLPYLDEASQYSGLMTLAKRANYRLRVIAYNENEQDVYGSYQLTEVTNESIKGRKQICRDGRCTEETDFISQNRRQQGRQY